MLNRSEYLTCKDRVYLLNIVLAVLCYTNVDIVYEMQHWRTLVLPSIFENVKYAQEVTHYSMFGLQGSINLTLIWL